MPFVFLFVDQVEIIILKKLKDERHCWKIESTNDTEALILSISEKMFKSFLLNIKIEWPAWKNNNRKWLQLDSVYSFHKFFMSKQTTSLFITHSWPMFGLHKLSVSCPSVWDYFVCSFSDSLLYTGGSNTMH